MFEYGEIRISHLQLEVHLIDGYEACQTSLLHVFVNMFGLDRAQTTIDFEACQSTWPIETHLSTWDTFFDFQLEIRSGPFQ